MDIRKFLYVLLLIPSLLSAQTYSACPKPGKTFITVQADTFSITVPITVREQSYDGTPTVLTENYNYSTIEQLRASSINTAFYGSQQSLSINPSCGVVRFNFDPTEHIGGTCDNYYIGYDVGFPQQYTEVFVEIWVRMDSTFIPSRPRADTVAAGCSAQMGRWWDLTGFVMLMGRVDTYSGAFGVSMGTGWPSVSRFNIGAACHFRWETEPTWSKQQDEDNRHSCGYHILNAQYDRAAHPDVYDSSYWREFTEKLQKFDGKWHRYRFWFKAGNTAPNLGGVGVWIDNEHMGTLSIQDVTADKLIGLAIGRLLHQKPVQKQFVEYGRIRVWSTNPGWNKCEKFCTF